MQKTLAVLLMLIASTVIATVMAMSLWGKAHAGESRVTAADCALLDPMMEIFAYNNNEIIRFRDDLIVEHVEITTQTTLGKNDIRIRVSDIVLDAMIARFKVFKLSGREIEPGVETYIRLCHKE